ncbi:uncharacterized protein [Apostichopus japonicus]|uniref:uncharacterized protein n=1 Tax=Stichopus japonicus TaxID=307972 RepID=UPI003AB16CA1
MRLYQIVILIVVVACNLNLVTSRTLKSGTIEGSFKSIQNGKRDAESTPLDADISTTASVPPTASMTTLCHVSQNDSTGSARPCTDPVGSLELVQRIRRQSGALNDRALCQWTYSRNTNLGRIPVDIWEAQCVPSESTDTHSCWRVTSQMLVLYRGECINGANTYTLGLEAIVTSCVPTYPSNS